MKPGLVVFLLLLLFGIFYVSTIRPGHAPGDDFALYIGHARNIAEGRAYGHTGYIYNPHNPGIGPPEYPPLFPLLLAGVYRMTGMNLTAMKIVNIVLLLAALYVIYVAFAKDLTFNYVVAALAVVACNPYIWGLKDEVLSDVLFLFLCYTVLWLSTLEYGKGRRSLLLVAATAGCVYLAFATRTAALVLIPVLVLTDLVRYRRLKLITMGSVLIASALILVQVRASHWSIPYVDRITVHATPPTPHAQPPGVLQVVWAYARGSRRCIHTFMWECENRLWRNDLGPSSTRLLCVTAALLGIAGYFLRLFRRPSVFEIFVAGYLGLVLLWRATDVRLLLPVIPLWVLYAATAVEQALRWNKRKPIVVCALILTVSQVALAYGSVYAHAQHGPIPLGIGDPNFQAMCRYINQNTSKTAVFVCSRPRLLALMTDRSVSAYYRAKEDTELWEYLRDISAQYIVYAPAFEDDRKYLSNFLARSNPRLHKVYANGMFAVYQVVPATQTAQAGAPQLPGLELNRDHE